MQTYFWKLQNNEQDVEVMQKAAEFIQAGEVVAFPTETVYGLGANGLNSEAVAKIFAAKGRPNDNPLILHILRQACNVSSRNVRRVGNDDIKLFIQR